MNSSQGGGEDATLISSGYKPELKRGLGYYSAFAISFSYMSALTGVVANFGFMNKHAGVFGIWTWLIVAVGHTLTALVFAEMVGKIPLTGSSYNWNVKLTNPTLGWFTGWMAFAAYTVGVSAVTVTLFPAIGSVLGHEFDVSEIKYASIIAIVFQGIINIYSVRFAAYFNVTAVFIEIAGMIFFGALLCLSFLFVGGANFHSLVVVPAEPVPYWPGFLMACLLTSWTLLGFEGAADISEETIDAKRVAPRGIINAMLSCSLVGFIFLAILAAAVPAAPSEAFNADPVNFVVRSHLGSNAANIFTAVTIIAIFACSLVNMTGASRLVFAMSRDDRFPASKLFKRVSRAQVPHAAIWLIVGLASMFAFLSDTATALYGAGAVLFSLFYLVTLVGYLFNHRKLPRSDSFELGVLRWIVAPLAIAWHVFETCVLTFPQEFHSVALATALVLIAGFVVFGVTSLTLRAGK